jgi:hypothetical protein
MVQICIIYLLHNVNTQTKSTINILVLLFPYAYWHIRQNMDIYLQNDQGGHIYKIYKYMERTSFKRESCSENIRLNYSIQISMYYNV